MSDAYGTSEVFQPGIPGIVGRDSRDRSPGRPTLPGGAPGVRDDGALASAIMRPQLGYYDTLIEEAAALMESLANNHPFVDGNKRVAFGTTGVFGA